MVLVAAGALAEPLALAAAATGVTWWTLLGVLVVARRPRRERTMAGDGEGGAGLDLPPEPPAVAGLLANGYVVTAESAPAVVLDLAARDLLELDEVQPGRTICRVRSARANTSGPPDAIADYERLVLDELGSKAVDGVVPTEALTTGPENQSDRWHRAFATAITSDAQRRGLTVARWSPTVVRMLGTGVLVVGSLVALAIWVRDDAEALQAIQAAALGVAIATVVGGAALTARLRRSLAQLPTPDGRVAAQRALLLAGRLRENETLAELPPAGVKLWDRVFAYAAAFGAAPAAVALLPMGAEDDRRAWSRVGGRWRRVTVSYPRAWPPAWGKHPFLALSTAIFWGVLAGAVLFGVGQLTDVARPDGISERAWAWAGRGALVALIPIVAALAWAVWVVVRAVPDLRQSMSVSGTIVRDRRTRQVFSSGDDPDYWYYLAIDDGSREEIRALRVRESLWRERSQGESVTAVVSPRLGYVRSIAPA